MMNLPPGSDSSLDPSRAEITAAPTRFAGPPMRSGPGESGQSGPPITVGFVVRALLRWWKIATPIGLVLASIAAAYVYLSFEEVYQARAWLRIESNYIAFQGARPGANPRTFLATQSQLMRSPIVLEQVLQRPDIVRVEEIEQSKSPVEYLAKRILVNSESSSELCLVHAKMNTPENAARVCNAVVEAYFKVQSEDEALRMQRTVELLDSEKSRRLAIINGLREQIKELRKAQDPELTPDEVSSDDIPLKHDLGDLMGKLTDLEAEKAILTARMQSYKAEYENAPLIIPNQLVEAEVMQNEQVRRLHKLTKDLSERLEQLAAAVAKGTQDPRYLQVEEEFNQVDKELNALKDRLREEISEEKRRDVRRMRQKRLDGYRNDLDDMELELGVLREFYVKEFKKKYRQGGQAGEISLHQSDINREQAVMRLIEARVMRIRTEMRAPARVTLLRAATRPAAPSNAVSFQRMGMYGLAAFCVPFALSVFWERMVRRVSGPQQLWEAEITVVGEVAKLPVASRMSAMTPGGSIGRDVSLFEESIDSLRTCLVLSENPTDSRVLVVTSAVSGEGKTSVASQLAVSIARSSGEQTLLIDADMRSPDIHNVFDIPNHPGLAQVLGHECCLDDAIVTTWSNYVHLLPAGVLKSSPHKLLGDGVLKSLLEQIRGKYRHVIVDTSPILSASESLVLAKAADATLLCAMRDSSRVDQVQRAYERLVNTGARPLGTVLNGVPTNRYAYLYGVYAYPRD